ncbi:MAG: NAD(+) synthase [Bacteroidota bacterium]|nr:NAD(+) synthase [Bacteroidota bacterium]
MQLHKDILVFDNVASVCENIQNEIRSQIFSVLHRRGAVVGISGGVDSSVTLALAATALGPDKVLGLMLPERDSSSESALLAQKLADTFGVKTITEDITGALEGFGCYRRRDEAVSVVFPEYDPKTYKMKIGIRQSGLKTGLPPVFYLTIVKPDGSEESKILPVNQYAQIVAASNFKQRSRMSMLYYHAERLHYAVVGTPNKHEVEQGFFVKYGDGGADLMPIGNFYKTQVYQLAKHLGVPEEIIKRTPTTDTYSAEQTQEEFFYQLPFEQMDLMWYAFENNISATEVAPVMDMSADEVEKIFLSFHRKQQTTDYLRRGPIHF